MARKNASNLDNQISLMDMMVLESPEYSEEKPKENQEIKREEGYKRALSLFSTFRN